MSQPNCFQHPETAASTRCGGCDKSLCAKCATFEGGKDRCEACVARYHKSKKVRAVAIGITVAVVMLLVTIPMAMRAGDFVGSGAVPEGSFDYGQKTAFILQLRKQLERQPCDKAKGREYAQALFDAGDLKGTVKAADAFIAQCGKSTALRQLSYTAHTQLQEFDLAAKDVTELIDGAPDNAGYYLWRGMAHEANGATDAAVADFRQAFLLKPEQPQAVNLLATAFGNRGQACEARLAVLEHLQAKPVKEQDPQMLERLGELGSARQCGIEGQGSAELTFVPRAPRVVEPLVGKERGRFLVDTDSARVVLSRAFADKLGLSLEGAPTVRLQAGHDILTVRLAKVPAMELQGARAANVEVAVADTLPEGADGLLGLSFLARFRVKEDAKAGRLQLSAR